MSTREVVQRVLPLLERLAARTLDRARLLQYLAARASADWGLLVHLGVEGDAADGEPVHAFHDRLNGEVRRVRRPDCLAPEWEQEVLDEYKRLALARPLTSMSRPLFDHFFRASHCDACRFDAPATRQVCRECHVAGWPIDFEARP